MGVWAIKRQLGVNGRNKMCSRDGLNDTDMHCVTECSKTKSIRRETGVANFSQLLKSEELQSRRRTQLLCMVMI